MKNVPVDWNGRYETPAGKACPRETPQASAEEAPGPPVESEYLEWKINDQIYKPSKKKFQLISEIRSLSADCLPSLLAASVCGVSASQLFGRSVANFFHPMRIS
ncbi:hypothetical protein [Peribacillus butanolivorans]|uniref:hypothetical protein n=1 Tax=Peribacillus butanolivorans TaxID=421767 RepID=UPI00366CB595